MFDARWRNVALVAVGLMLTAARGSGQQARQPNSQTPTGLPPGAPTQQSPSGLLIPVQPPPAPPSTLLQNYKPVDAERLKHPEDGDWLMVRRTYDGWGYSPLEQITPANVGRLQPVWLMSTGMNNGHQAPPFVNNGVMFVATSYNQLIAINAKTGGELWRYRSPSPQDARVPKPVNRGVALYGDKVFFALGEAVLVAIDPKTGRPEIDPDHKTGVGRLASFCPSWHGGKNWEPGAFNPKTRMVYIPTQENLCAVMLGRVLETPVGGRRAATTNQMYIAPGADHIGEVQAWNVDTGKKAWSHHFKDSPNWGPILTTGGGLVFSGGTNDRMFRAYDATTGVVLWEHPTNSGVYAPPSSFMVDGRQYIAVVSGWGQDARSMESRINGVSLGHYPDVPEGGVIWVFAVK